MRDTLTFSLRMQHGLFVLVPGMIVLLLALTLKAPAAAAAPSVTVSAVEPQIQPACDCQNTTNVSWECQCDVTLSGIFIINGQCNSCSPSTSCRSRITVTFGGSDPHCVGQGLLICTDACKPNGVGCNTQVDCPAAGGPVSMSLTCDQCQQI